MMTSTTAKKIIIRVIVALFLIISGLAFVPYLLPASTPTIPEDITADLETYLDTEITDIVVASNETPNVNTPEENDIQVVVTEKENQNEMEQTVEVLLENGEIDTPTLGDFSDSLQLAQ
jgi:hypothetical protein